MTRLTPTEPRGLENQLRAQVKSLWIAVTMLTVALLAVAALTAAGFVQGQDTGSRIAQSAVSAAQQNVDARYDDCQSMNRLLAGLRAQARQSRRNAPLLYRLVPSLHTRRVETEQHGSRTPPSTTPHRGRTAHASALDHPHHRRHPRGTRHHPPRTPVGRESDTPDEGARQPATGPGRSKGGGRGQGRKRQRRPTQSQKSLPTRVSRGDGRRAAGFDYRAWLWVGASEGA